MFFTGFAIFVLYACIFLDFSAITGLGLQGGLGFALWLMLRVALQGFSETIPALKKNFSAAWLGVNYCLILGMTYFIL